VANQISRRGRGDRTCTEPMGVEVPRLALFRLLVGNVQVDGCEWCTFVLWVFVLK